MSKKAIIYHQIKSGTPCADGIAAAWVASKKYPDADVIGASFNSDLPDVNDYDSLVIVDFSFPLTTLQTWESQGKKVFVIDHHKTAMADLSQFTNALFNMDESGASLTWLHYFPDQPIPAFIQYVKDRDLWNFNLPQNEEIHEAMGFLGRTFKST